MTLVVETFNTPTGGSLWTAPANITGNTDIEAWGAASGAGGGGAPGLGGGSGAGGYSKKTVTALAGDTITYRIGARGTGGAGGAINGVNGNAALPFGNPTAEKTTGAFTLSIFANPGARGNRGTSIANGTGGNGGTASGGDVNTTGGAGTGAGGVGGSSPNGGTGGTGGAPTSVGGDGNAPGGGGGGGGLQVKGGDGANGKAQFTYNIVDAPAFVLQRGFIANMGRFMNC